MRNEAERQIMKEEMHKNTKKKEASHVCANDAALEERRSNARGYGGGEGGKCERYDERGGGGKHQSVIESVTVTVGMAQHEQTHPNTNQRPALRAHIPQHDPSSAIR